VPSWQLKPKDETPPETDSEPAQISKEDVIEQAKKFLDDDEVRDASTDKKIAFLESKGLESGEIQTLLGVTRNPDATAAPAENAPQPTTPQSSPPAQSTQAQPRDTPPIITYPEFLTTPTAPSPLVTRARLIATLYTFAGLSTLLYGTNAYLVTPMIAQLTTARLSLSATALSNVRRLVSQLQTVVSEIPMTTSLHQDEESEDEDPTELFHRDVGVQTSRPPSPTSYLHPSMDKKPASTVDEQATRLSALGTSLTGLLEDAVSEGHDQADLSTTIGMLRDYLDGLAYVTPSFYGAGGYSSFTAQNKEDDEIGRVKASIRGVKGVLLSARTFPGPTRTR